MKHLKLAAALFPVLLLAQTGHATTIEVKGTYSITQGATYGTNGWGSLSQPSNPLGSPFNLSGTPFDVFVPVNGGTGPSGYLERNFLTFNPESTSGASCKSGSISHNNCKNDIAKQDITAKFNFTTPGGQSGNFFSVTGTFYADYHDDGTTNGLTGIAGCGTGGKTGQTDCIVWNTGSPDPFTVTFVNGFNTDVLTVNLLNAEDWSIVSPIRLSITETTGGGGHQEVPEPSALALLVGPLAGLLGMGMVRRRRRL